MRYKKQRTAYKGSHVNTERNIRGEAGRSIKTRITRYNCNTKMVQTFNRKTAVLR
jgi:hypothetical protein